MKKLLAKARRKKQPEEPAGRITTDTLAEHRERVLAGGRKFKYPVQYQRHKLVINTIIISIAAVLLLVGIVWYLLYPAQNSSDFIYRITKVVPVPVATVDGQAVRYSSYLMQYRSSVHFLTEKGQIDTNSADGKQQLELIKNQSINSAIADAYTIKLAREHKIEVTNAEIEALITQQRQRTGSSLSETSYNSIIQDYYGWSPDEYREIVKNKLLRQKVAFAIDNTAKKTSETVASRVKGGELDFEKIAAELNAQTKGSAEYTAPVWVPKDNQDDGLAKAAGGLEKGQISTALQVSPRDGSYGYYFVKLIDSNETQVQYALLRIPLATFDTRLAALDKAGKITKFITIEDTTGQE